MYHPTNNVTHRKGNSCTKLSYVTYVMVLTDSACEDYIKLGEGHWPLWFLRLWVKVKVCSVVDKLLELGSMEEFERRYEGKVALSDTT